MVVLGYLSVIFAKPETFVFLECSALAAFSSSVRFERRSAAHCSHHSAYERLSPCIALYICPLDAGFKVPQTVVVCAMFLNLNCDRLKVFVVVAFCPEVTRAALFLLHVVNLFFG